MSTHTSQPAADIQKAIDQLNQSDRGHAALVALAGACDRFTGLDIINQRAVLSLVSSVFSYPQSGREAIKRGAASGTGFY